MAPEELAVPLVRLPIFRTSDAEQFADKTHAVFGATRAKLENAQDFKRGDSSSKWVTSH